MAERALDRPGELGGLTIITEIGQRAILQTANRFRVDEREWGLSLAQAIILAEWGDVIVVHTERQKVLGEQMARSRQPDKRITFVVEPSQEAGDGQTEDGKGQIR